MKNKRIISILFIPFLFLAFVFIPSAQAKVTIPPSQECLDLMDQQIANYAASEENSAGDRAWFQVLVDAGCLPANPIDLPDEGSKKCAADFGKANSYLAKANRFIRPFVNRKNRLETNYLKTDRKLSKMLKKAVSKKQGKKIRAINKKQSGLFKKYQNKLNKIVKDATGVIQEYDAPVLLISYDLIANGCKVPDGWWNKYSLFAYAFVLNK